MIATHRGKTKVDDITMYDNINIPITCRNILEGGMIHMREEGGETLGESTMKEKVGQEVIDHDMEEEERGNIKMIIQYRKDIRSQTTQRIKESITQIIIIIIRPRRPRPPITIIKIT